MDEKASQDANRSEGSPPPATSALSFDPRDLIPTPIFCAAPDGRLIWMNAAAEQLTGRLAPAISGEPFTCLFPEEGRRSIARRFIRNRRRKIQDFYLEVDFHFESSVVPLLSRAAPSDTYRIWKRGADLRADTTLAGFDGLRIRRADHSFLFFGQEANAGGRRLPPGSLLVFHQSTFMHAYSAARQIRANKKRNTELYMKMRQKHTHLDLRSG